MRHRHSIEGIIFYALIACGITLLLWICLHLINAISKLYLYWRYAVLALLITLLLSAQAYAERPTLDEIFGSDACLRECRSYEGITLKTCTDICSAKPAKPAKPVRTPVLSPQQQQYIIDEQDQRLDEMQNDIDEQRERDEE